MSEIEIHGTVAPGFEPVRDAFAQNFAEDKETGAAFALKIGDERKVDIWAGIADGRDGTPWAEDTIVPVFSTGKAVAAIVLAWLNERGLFDYDQPIAGIWPDFAAQGKDVSIAEALSHQAGVPGFHEEIDPQLWFDMDGIAAKLAAEEPFWEPGTASGYHAITFGVIAQEIARRTDGRTIGTILAEDFTEAEALDLFIGTPESEHARTAALVKPRGLPDMGEINDATRAAFMKPWSSPGGRGSADWRVAEFPAANTHATARSLADFMGLACDGALNGDSMLGGKALTALRRERIHGDDLVLPFRISWAAGLMRNAHGVFGPGTEAVAHAGWGGSCAVADPARNLTAAYVMNRQGPYLMGDPRPTRIIEAVYSCV